MTPVCIIVTPGMAEILRELAHDGATNPEIADRLSVSINTVKAQFKNIKELLPPEYGNRTTLALGLHRKRIIVRVLKRRM